MKVRVELNLEDGGLESDFSVVEFATVHADSVHGWADAVRTFAGVARGMYDTESILASALFIEGGWLVKDWAKIVELLGSEEKDKLRIALESST
jgi:hypothetical protein